MRLHERVRSLEGSADQPVTLIGINHNSDDTMFAAYGGETIASEPNEQEAAFRERMTQRARHETRGLILILTGSDIEG